MPEPVLAVVGASGAGRRLVDIALDMMDSTILTPFRTVVVVDDDPSSLNLSRLDAMGVTYAGTSEQWLASSPISHFAVGIGDTRTRRRLAQRFTEQGHVPATLVAPTARISRTAVLGSGCAISPGVDLSTNVTLGNFVHVMANAAISHDALVGDYANVNPGAVLAGECRLGAGATLGAGAVLRQGIRVGEDATVGAGAVVTRDVSDRTVVKGVPAR